MSKDPRLVEGLKRLAGPVDRRGVWTSLEARAAAERSRVALARRRRPRLVLAGLAALVLLAGIGVGVYEAVRHWQSDARLLITDATAMVPEPGATADDWARLPLSYDAASVWCLAMDPSDPSVLYAGTTGGIVYKSTDGAATWKPVLDMHGSVDYIGIDPNEPHLLYVLGTARSGFVHVLMRTTDGGATWSDLSAAIGLGETETGGFSSGDPLFDTRTTPSRVYVFANGTWKSKDGGDHWSKASDDEVSEVYPYAKVREPAAAPRWIVDQATGQEGLVTGLGALTDPVDANVRYVATMLGVFKSKDGGTTWQNASRGMTSGRVDSLVVDPGDPARLYAATPVGIFRSTDRGASWKRILGGGTYADENGGGDGSGSLVVANSQPHTLYARTPLGLFRSDNGGDEWATLAGAGLPTLETPTGLNNPVVLVAPDDADVVFVRAMDGIYRSADGGASFSRVLDPPAGLLADPRNDSRIYAVWETGEVLVSLDAGAHWDSSSYQWDISYAPLWGAVIDAIGAEAPLHSVIAGEDGNPRGDGVDSVTPTHMSPLPEAAGAMVQLLFDPTSTHTVFAVGATQGDEAGRLTVLWSTNSGLAWQDITGALHEVGRLRLSIDPGGKLYAATDRGLFRWEP